ncbi:MAG: HAD family hydrolase [Chloroflexi bacterium]|nr:MAG: HAD family hydrolase [Chloroflexota bacterium]MBL1196246.1 HAD family hydrolase [Chloroflexota bacterium]NOH13541.1 HAD family hydrolase [Chloroflexota bacterium]
MRALIFDFDGLIVDTEIPDYESWQEIYRQHDCELPLEKWALIVGGDGTTGFDPFDYLEESYGQPIDREAIWIKRRKRDVEITMRQPVLPGVKDYIRDAKAQGLKLAVASSSPESWVKGHLTRLGLWEQFDAVRTADDVEQTKPAPDLFLAALDALGVQADEAIVLEDSPNGLTAAREAGVFCVAVPNGVTKLLDISHADLILDSLAELSLDDLITKTTSK